MNAEPVYFFDITEIDNPHPTNYSSVRFANLHTLPNSGDTIRIGKDDMYILYAIDSITHCLLRNSHSIEIKVKRTGGNAPDDVNINYL